MRILVSTILYSTRMLAATFYLLAGVGGILGKTVDFQEQIDKLVLSSDPRFSVNY